MNLVRSKKGQSMVETAIILPVLLLLIMGIIDFGLLFNNYILLSNAAREGGRKAALGGTDAEIVNLVQNLTTTLDNDLMNIMITPAASLRVSGSEVIVRVTYDSQFLTPMIEDIFAGGIPLDTRIVMRVE